MWKSKILKQIYDEERIKYKRCYHYLIVLYITSDIETNENRNRVIDKRFAKFRAARAWCVCIFDTFVMKTVSKYLNHVGEFSANYYANGWVFPTFYDTNVNNICSAGIHFFNHCLGAYFYHQMNEDDDSVKIDFDNSGCVDTWRDASVGWQQVKERHLQEIELILDLNGLYFPQTLF